MPRAHLRLVDADPRPAVTRPVAPNSDLLELYRLRKLIEPALAAEACVAISDRRLDHLGASMSEPLCGHEAAGSDARAITLELLRPAMGWWDMQTLFPPQRVPQMEARPAGIVPRQHGWQAPRPVLSH